jgi:predicted alpha/beta-fold hydrolase
VGERCSSTTVHLPVEMVESIDRLEQDRSRFITRAVERELVRRRRERLQRSLESPPREAVELAETGLADWTASLSAGDDELVDVAGGTAVRWVEGRGWVEDPA